MRFPCIRLVEQTEQKFRRFESVLRKEKKRVIVIVRLVLVGVFEENARLFVTISAGA